MTSFETTSTFALTYDYLCPFARIAHEAVVDGIGEGRPWTVEFRPFSLSQSHIDEGSADVWDRPVGTDGTRGVLALEWSLAVRDEAPGQFLAFHRGLFTARHDHAADIGDLRVLGEVATGAGLDPAMVSEVVGSGQPRKRLAEEHTEAVERWAVFGVPTFIAGDEAVFVRLMERGRIDDIEQVLRMLDWSRLNEFKRTRLAH